MNQENARSPYMLIKEKGRQHAGNRGIVPASNVFVHTNTKLGHLKPKDSHKPKINFKAENRLIQT